MENEDIIKRRKYQLDIYYNKKDKYIKMFGGKCIKCNSTNNLEFDHINPSNKKYNITNSWTKSDDDLLKELEKCQLLCQQCHTIKSVEESGKVFVKGQNIHGTISSIRYCKCNICKKFKSEYHKKYMFKKTGKVTGSSHRVSPYLSRLEEILKLSRTGLSAYKISPIVNIPRATVDRLIRKYKK